MSNPRNPWQEVDNQTVKGRVLHTLSGVANRVRATGLVIFNGRPADGELLTLTFDDADGTELILEWDSDATLSDPSHVAIDISGSGDVNGDATALYNTLLSLAAQTGVQPFQPTSGTVTPNVLLVAAGPNAVNLDVAGEGNVESYNVEQGGSPLGSPEIVAIKHEVDQFEVDQGVAHIAVPFLPLQANLTLVDSSFNAKAWDGAVTVIPFEGRIEAAVGTAAFADGDFIVGTVVGEQVGEDNVVFA